MPQAIRPNQRLYGLAALLCLLAPVLHAQLGLGHNQLLQQAHTQGWLSQPLADEQLYQRSLALAGVQYVLPNDKMLHSFSAAYDQASPYDLQQQLGLSTACAALLNELWQMPEANDRVQALDLIAHMRLAAHALPANERDIVWQACEVATHSAAFWVDYVAPDDSTKPISKRKLRWQRLMKADAYGVLKGALFGLFFFGANGVVFQLGLSMGVAGGLGIFVFFTAFESIRYANKLKAGKVKLEDDPWWGVQENKPF